MRCWLSVAAELGDYEASRYKPGYVAEFRFLAHQSSDLENKIAELHKSMRYVFIPKNEFHSFFFFQPIVDCSFIFIIFFMIFGKFQLLKMIDSVAEWIRFRISWRGSLDFRFPMNHHDFH